MSTSCTVAQRLGSAESRPNGKHPRRRPITAFKRRRFAKQGGGCNKWGRKPAIKSTGQLESSETDLADATRRLAMRVQGTPPSNSEPLPNGKPRPHLESGWGMSWARWAGTRRLAGTKTTVGRPRAAGAPASGSAPERSAPTRCPPGTCCAPLCRRFAGTPPRRSSAFECVFPAGRPKTVSKETLGRKGGSCCKCNGRLCCCLGICQGRAKHPRELTPRTAHRKFKIANQRETSRT
jgi:hypothetical protein